MNKKEKIRLWSFITNENERSSERTMCSRSFPEYFLSASIMVKETTEKVQFYFENHHEKRTGYVLNCLTKQPTFHDSPLVFQLNDVCRNSTLFTCHYPELGSALWWVVSNEICLSQWEALPSSAKWHVTSMDVLQSVLRRHFAGKPLVW